MSSKPELVGYLLNEYDQVQQQKDETRISEDLGSDDNVSAHTYNKSRSHTGNSIHCIEIITNDNDPGSILLSAETIANRFKEGVIVFDFGQIHVYLNISPDFISDIENTARERQMGISSIFDVFVSYKTFLLYRNKSGNVMVLPKNQHFFSIFQRLFKVSNTVISCSKVYILLKDVLKDNLGYKSYTSVEHRHVRDRKHVQEPEENCQEISVKLSKQKTKWSKHKVTGVRSSQNLPLTLQLFGVLFPYVGEELKFPIEVSEDQRDETQAHSEQVVSGHHTNFSVLTYDFGPQSRVGGESTAVTSYAGSQEVVPPTHARPRIPSRHKKFSSYVERLSSYLTWPHGRPSPEILSKAGFFFTGREDLVRCFQCDIGLKDFSAEDDPLLEHVRHSGHCPFLSEMLGEETLSMYQEKLQAIDPEYFRRQQLRDLHNRPHSRPVYRHPEYQTVEARILSFVNWPSQTMQRPEQLAEAGLYYTGSEDHVRCFACDGGLRRWDPGDDPWTEHCRWFPACPYAIEQKGEQFIALVQASTGSEGYEASGGVRELSNAMEVLQLKESEIEHTAKEHRDVCLEMGYKEEDLKAAVKELLERGNERPSLGDILDLIEIVRERKESARPPSSKSNESPMEEHERLKHFVFCMSCETNNVNALFLPCAHHNLCMSCAESLDKCPICHRPIREKIRTYMV